MEDKNLCLIKQRFRTINTDSRVLIYLGDTPEQAAPFAAIPVRERKTDREACLLAMEWLREHRHITTRDYLHEVEKFLLSEAAHPTQAADRYLVPRRRNGQSGRDRGITGNP